MSRVHYSNMPEHNPVIFPGSFNMTQCDIPSLEDFDGYLDHMLRTQTPSPQQEFPLQPHYTRSNNSTSHETDDLHQLYNVTDMRKQRRMISNRESARRSRMKKQRHLDELWSSVLRLKNENLSLTERLNGLSQSCDKLAQENSKLKDEACDLRQILTSLNIGSPPYIGFHDLDEEPCNMDHHRAAFSIQSITSFTDLLY